MSSKYTTVILFTTILLLVTCFVCVTDAKKQQTQVNCEEECERVSTVSFANCLKACKMNNTFKKRVKEGWMLSDKVTNDCKPCLVSALAKLNDVWKTFGSSIHQLNEKQSKAHMRHRWAFEKKYCAKIFAFSDECRKYPSKPAPWQLDN
jgi:hypothetical protein